MQFALVGNEMIIANPAPSSFIYHLTGSLVEGTLVE